MCNCIKEVEERLNIGINSVPEYANLEEKSLSLDNIAIMFEGGTQMSGSATIMHKPVGRKQKTVLHICYKYCPFCGEKYEMEDKQ